MSRFNHNMSAPSELSGPRVWSGYIPAQRHSSAHPPHSDHCSTLRLGMDSPRLFVNPGFICGKQELVADVLQHGRWQCGDYDCCGQFNGVTPGPIQTNVSAASPGRVSLLTPLIVTNTHTVLSVQIAQR